MFLCSVWIKFNSVPLDQLGPLCVSSRTAVSKLLAELLWNTHIKDKKDSIRVRLSASVSCFSEDICKIDFNVNSVSHASTVIVFSVISIAKLTLFN